MATDVLRRAQDMRPHEGWIILVIGKQGSGKSTFIEGCTEEDYLDTYQSDSSKSHISRTYEIEGHGGVMKECHYREIPSFLDTANNSARILYEFALFLLLNHGRNHIAGIVYMLDHTLEVQHPSLHKDLSFNQGWIGDNCSASTVLVQNRMSDTAPTYLGVGVTAPTIRSLWFKYMGTKAHVPQSLHDNTPLAIVGGIIVHPEYVLKLQRELMDKRKLKDTTIGKLYLDQLNEWIDKAKSRKRSLKKQNGNYSLLKAEIKSLQSKKKEWKRMKL